jgi:hypothetical protein
MARGRKNLDGTELMWIDGATELAETVGRAFVVGTSTESMLQAALAKPEKYIMATKGGTLATEEILPKVAGAKVALLVYLVSSLLC